MAQPQVLFCGDPDWAEFIGPIRWLNERASVKCTPEASRVVAALYKDAFDAVVIGQRRPGELSDRFLEGLRQAAPLTPIVCLLGSLCEGEMRSGAPWPGAIRCYAHRFVAQMGSQFAQLARFGSTKWAPPFTATEEDRSVTTELHDSSHSSQRIAVISSDREARTALFGIFHHAGFSTTALGGDWERLDESVEVIVWDCVAGFAECRASFDRAVQVAPQTPKFVILGFPRAHDLDDALSRGATAVVSKPFLVDELLWQVGECLSARERALGLSAR